MADDLTLKWDAQNNELYAEDSNGSRTPVPFSSVNTDQLNYQQGSVATAIRNNTSNSFSSGTYNNLVDTDGTDKLGELQGSGQFKPDNSGTYRFVTQNNTNGSEGDRIHNRVQNVSDGTTVFDRKQRQSTSNGALNQFILTVDLTAGKTYEVQVSNEDSSFELFGGNYDLIRVVPET